MQDFIYIPAEGDKSAFWLNLSLVGKILELSDGSLTIYGQAMPVNLTGRRADVLRLHLMGRAMSHRPEPELPRIPDPAIVPPAVKEFEACLERRGYGAFE